MRKFYLIIFFVSVLLSCKNIDSAEPSPLRTFIRFYEGPYSMSAQAIEKTPDGYVIMAIMTSGNISNPVIQTVLIETDDKGIQQGDFKIYNDIIGKSFKPIIKNGALDKYIIVGDKIVINPLAEQAANVAISAMKVLIINSSFNKEDSISLADRSANKPVRDDYSGASVTINENGEVILLGTFKEGIINQQSAPEEQLLFGLNTSLDSAWVKRLPLLGNTFLNSRSIHSYKGNVVWASAVADVQGDFTSSYVAIPFVPENSFPVNYSMTGENSPQLYLPKDIQPFASPAFGYGVTGTYSANIDGSKGNVFFFKVDVNGNIIPGSKLFFDGEDSMNSEPTDLADENTSTVIDSGEALIGTSDGGFVLAGTLTNTDAKDTDILLIKINGFGEKQWIKKMGASGDQNPVSIREADNGDLLICGTHTLGNYSTVFLMRTDNNGEIKN